MLNTGQIFKRLLSTFDVVWYLISCGCILVLVLVLFTPDARRYKEFSAADIQGSEYLQENEIEAGDYIEIARYHPREYGSIIRAEDMPDFFPERLWEIDRYTLFLVIGLLAYLLLRWILVGSVYDANGRQREQWLNQCIAAKMRSFKPALR